MEIQAELVTGSILSAHMYIIEVLPGRFRLRAVSGFMASKTPALVPWVAREVEWC